MNPHVGERWDPRPLMIYTVSSGTLNSTVPYHTRYGGGMAHPVERMPHPLLFYHV